MKKLSEELEKEILEVIRLENKFNSGKKKLTIDNFREYASWWSIPQHIPVSEEFISEFKNEINWYSVSMYRKLREDFIRKFKNKVIWDVICHTQKLSEEFIREFKEYVLWERISRHQNLSEDFIKEFKDKSGFDYWAAMTNLENRLKAGMTSKFNILQKVKCLAKEYPVVVTEKKKEITGTIMGIHAHREEVNGKSVWSLVYDVNEDPDLYGYDAGYVVNEKDILSVEG